MIPEKSDSLQNDSEKNIEQKKFPRNNCSKCFVTFLSKPLMVKYIFNKVAFARSATLLKMDSTT